MADAQKTPPTLASYKKMFDDARDTTPAEARKQSITDRDYYDGEQLNGSVGGVSIKAILANRGQPEIVINRIKPAINGTRGVVEQGKTDPRAYMRNPPEDKPQAQQQPQAMQPGAPQQPAPKPDLDAGDVASMTLRYIADTNRFQTLKMDVLENILVEGCGATIIEIDENRDVVCSQIRWEEYFYDPRSRKADFSDARYHGIAKWMYADDVIGRYEAKASEIEAAVNAGDMVSAGESWQDRPDDQKAWVDKAKRRLMVVELYYREGSTWFKCVFHSGGKLEEAAPVPYKDDKDRSICPIEAQSGYVDRKNNRYGMVRDMRGPQDEVNMRRIKAIHEINSRQIQQNDPNAPPIDTATARAEAARADGVLPPGWQIVPRGDVVANNVEMLQEAKSEIERMGPNPAILGRQGADASGRAQQVRQQAGLTELAPILGRFSDWELRCYRQMWFRARQFWDAPRWIRVANDDNAPQYVRVNDPGPLDPVTQQPLGPPKNHIAKMDVDIVIDSVPDTATLQQEVFTELVQLAQAYVGTPQQIPFSVLVEMSPLPKRREILKKLEEAQGEAAQANAPAMQLDMADKAAKVGKTQADAGLATAKTKQTEVQTVVAALQGHMDAHAANVLPPGHAEVANLPQNQPRPTGAGP